MAMVLSTKRELAQAYDEQRLTWLRKRFAVYAWISIVISSLGLLGSLVALVFFLGDLGGDETYASLTDSTVFWVSEVGLTLLVMAVFIAALRWVRAAKPGREETLRLIYWLFVGAHLLDMAQLLFVGIWVDATAVMGTVLDQAQIGLFISHLFVSIIIPWTVRESVRPLLPVIIVHAALIALFTADPIEHRVFDLLVLAALGLPGMFVCWLKQAWFRRRFQFRSYRDVYHYVSREVEQARNLHESFFPAPIFDGPVRLDYRYQPMSQLGGDYLHAHVCTDDGGRPNSLLCAVIDVTGHGLPATLTANHLHALLKRATQTQKCPDPGELINDLNRYMHESFSGLSVFATALCMRLDVDQQRVVWASAGHPPGFLVSEGHCEPALESTACLLGVIEPDLYDANKREMPISGNVQLFAYTDGASELPLESGGMLGINGLAERLAALSGRGPWSCAAVMKDLVGLAPLDRQDDILLVRLGIEAGTVGPRDSETHEAVETRDTGLVSVAESSRD